MSILSWNCWELENLQTVNALKRAMNKKASICVFLMETNMKQNWDYNQGLVVSSKGLSGDLALLWKPETQVHIKNFSRWFIDANVVCTNTGGSSLASMGHPDTSKWEETWTLLESLRHSSNLPWLCVGDYNENISQSEKSGGSLRPTRQMDRFRTVIHYCGFVDLGTLDHLSPRLETTLLMVVFIFG